MKRSVFEPIRHQELLARLQRLAADSPRQWGRMTAHEAVCHLSDSFKAILGDRIMDARPVDLKRRLVRFIAFTLPFAWPRGRVETSAEVDPQRQGTPPGEFARDVEELVELLQRFVASDGRTLAAHYAWGNMSRSEWGRYGYRHVDHHLQQFGV